jgi:class 3 adenylate cyclase
MIDGLGRGTRGRSGDGAAPVGGAAAAAHPPLHAGAIVFTDIVGFTELTDLHGDDAAVALVERQATLVRSRLPPSARIVKELGDGLLLWFDDAVAALCLALDVQDLSMDAPSEDELPLWLRIGLHWGAPRRRGDDIIGHDVNLTSRVANLAGPGEVLCTGAMVDAIGGPRAIPGVELDFVGATYVKGLSDPVPISRARRR